MDNQDPNQVRLGLNKVGDDQQSVSTTGSVQKEQEVAGFIETSSPEPKIPDEIREIGVEAVPEQPIITNEAIKAQVSPAKESTPVNIQSPDAVVIAQIEIETAGIKGTKNSGSWLRMIADKVKKIFQKRKFQEDRLVA